MGHHVENTGDRPVRFLEMFKSDKYADVYRDVLISGFDIRFGGGVECIRPD